jgi:predicted ABC-type ATPase
LNPKLYIIAGPNGAGKTTFAGKFLPTCTTSREFVNADMIAQRLMPSNPEAASLRAAREMLERINALAAQRMDFTIETTLSGKTYLPWLRNLKNSGYELHLYFLWLPDVSMSIMRVANRVRNGGHNIPEAVIRRRYVTGVKNLFRLYRPLLNSWSLFDNSQQPPYLIARETDKNLVVFDTLRFAESFNMAVNPSDETLRESAEVPDWMPALIALRQAQAQVIEDHCKTGDPIILWRDGRVYLQPPKEAKRELDQAIKSGTWYTISAPVH